MRDPLSNVKLILYAFFGTEFQNTVNELANTDYRRLLIDLIEVISRILSFKWVDKDVDQQIDHFELTHVLLVLDYGLAFAGERVGAVSFGDEEDYFG